MVRALLVRGMLVGLIAGLIAFALAYFLGEPQVQRAIDFEDRIAAAAAQTELVSRDVQRTWGLLTGTVVIGVALGGLFALVYAWAYGRVGGLGARATAAGLALAAFVTITLVPFTKYPANPPGVGAPETLDRRTLLAFAMVVIAVAALVAAGRVRAQLLERLGPWDASILAGAVFVLLVVVAELILPAVHGTPESFPADLLYRYRMASLATSAAMWLTIGLGFGVAAERLLAAAAYAPGPARRLQGARPLR